MVREQLAERGIRDPRVLDAMRRIDRAQFVEEPYRAEAWEDRALPARLGQTISQPYIVGFMTEKLEVQPDHRVLEVGTGTGYQAAILGLLAREVVSIERHGELAEQARERLAAVGVTTVRVLTGDGSAGVPERAPFDRILVTAAAPRVPQALFDQLADGGILVAPEERTPGATARGGEPDQVLRRWRRNGERFKMEEHFAVRFVPLVGDEPLPLDDAPERGPNG